MLKLNLAAHSAQACCVVRGMSNTDQPAKAVSCMRPALSSSGRSWAGVAQSVEHLICNQRVGGSNPFASSTPRYVPLRRQSSKDKRIWLYCSLASGARDPHHSFQIRVFRMKSGSCAARRSGQAEDAQVAEWLMAADCKSAALRSYEGSNPSLCTTYCRQEATMEMRPQSEGRLAIGLGILGALALLAWQTMEPGKFRSLTWLLLGFSAFRMLLLRFRSRYSGNGSVEDPHE